MTSPDPVGPAMADIAAGDYADDTEAAAPNPDALQRLSQATERRLRLTGQEMNLGKSTTWTLARDRAEAMQLLGSPILRRSSNASVSGSGCGLSVGTGPMLRQ